MQTEMTIYAISVVTKSAFKVLKYKFLKEISRIGRAIIPEVFNLTWSKPLLQIV